MAKQIWNSFIHSYITPKNDEETEAVKMKENEEELTFEEEEFLKTLIHNGIVGINPSFQLEGIVYEGLTPYFPDYTTEEIKNLVQSIAKKGYFESKTFEPMIFCPKCDSTHILSRFGCPRCESNHITNLEIIEHPLCGYRGSKDTYQHGAELICPNCNTHLSNDEGNNKGNYRILGNVYQCESCGKKLDKPKIVFDCQNCGSTFDYRDVSYRKPLGFVIPEKLVRELVPRSLIKVLLVEDSIEDAGWIMRFLEDSEDETRYEIDHVELGADGLVKLEEEKFDVVLLDFNLPNMSGLEMITQIKASGSDVPVIMLTGTDDRKTAVDSMKLGAADYLVKSTESYQSLQDRIKKVVN
jgi:CheY-like chemotaxis protein